MKNRGQLPYLVHPAATMQTRQINSHILQSSELAGVPNILGWWRADTNVLAVGGGVAGEGVAVGSWQDRRGTGEALTTLSPSSRPTQRIASGWVEMGTDTLTFAHSAKTSALYIYVALQTESSGAASNIVGFFNGSAHQRIAVFPSLPQVSAYASDGGSSGEAALAIGGFSTDLLLKTSSTNNYALGGNVIKDLDTGSSASSQCRPVSATSFQIYGQSGRKIREVIAVAGALTTGQQSTIESYLASRYP